MKERLSREAMAMRIARELFDGAVVNLGIGIPTLVSSFVPEGMSVIYHTENGALGIRPGGHRRRDEGRRRILTW